MELNLLTKEQIALLNHDEEEEYYVTILAEDYARCEQSLRQFVGSAFREVLDPVTEFIDGWHIDLKCEYLELVSEGQIKRLLIEEPPRYMKSLNATVCWPVWNWIHQPAMRFSFVSYSGELSTDHSLKRRDVMKSEWFKRKWGHLISFTDDQDRKTQYKNTATGEMFSTSTGGSFTGKGGHGIIIDDPLSPKLAYSKAHREAANRFYDNTVSTRLDSKKNGFIVIVMQRLHIDDLAGHVLKKEQQRRLQQLKSDYDFTVLRLEAISETNKTITFPKSKRIVKRNEGDLLWPEREGQEEIEHMKLNLGSYGFAAQYQQRPTPEGGGIINRSWFKYFEECPVILRCGWYWDTAVKEKQMNDYSVGLLLAKCHNGVYVLNMIRKKLIYPDLKIEVRSAYNESPSQFVMIEDKTSGEELIQEFQLNDNFPVFAFKPLNDKVQRASMVSPFIESGKVFLPISATWLRTFLEEFEQFPRGAHDDIVDALTMGLHDLMLNKKIGTYAGLVQEEKQLTQTQRFLMADKDRDTRSNTLVEIDMDKTDLW